MKRREFLRSAAFVAGANATAVLASAAPSDRSPDTSTAKSVGKIALEEHFMVPDFVEYFAETYPNISPEIAKLGLAALLDLDERRIATMDQSQIDFVILSLAGPECRLKETLRLLHGNRSW